MVAPWISLYNTKQVILFFSHPFLKINAIRLAINLAIGSQNAIADWGSSAVDKIQKEARDVLLE